MYKNGVWSAVDIAKAEVLGDKYVLGKVRHALNTRYCVANVTCRVRCTKPLMMFDDISFCWAPSQFGADYATGPCFAFKLSGHREIKNTGASTNAYVVVPLPELANGKRIYKAHDESFGQFKIELAQSALGQLRILAVMCGAWSAAWDPALVKWLRDAVTCGVAAQLAHYGVNDKNMTDAEWKSAIRGEFTTQLSHNGLRSEYIRSAIKMSGKAQVDVIGNKYLLDVLHNATMCLEDIRAVWPWAPYAKYRPDDITMNFVRNVLKDASDAGIAKMINSMYPAAGMVQNWYGRYELERLHGDKCDLFERSGFGTAALEGTNYWVLWHEPGKLGHTVVHARKLEDAVELADKLSKRYGIPKDSFQITRDLRPTGSSVKQAQ